MRPRRRTPAWAAPAVRRRRRRRRCRGPRRAPAARCGRGPRSPSTRTRRTRRRRASSGKDVNEATGSLAEAGVATASRPANDGREEPSARRGRSAHEGSRFREERWRHGDEQPPGSAARCHQARRAVRRARSTRRPRSRSTCARARGCVACHRATGPARVVGRLRAATTGWGPTSPRLRQSSAMRRALGVDEPAGRRSRSPRTCASRHADRPAHGREGRGTRVTGRGDRTRRRSCGQRDDGRRRRRTASTAQASPTGAPAGARRGPVRVGARGQPAPRVYWRAGGGGAHTAALELPAVDAARRGPARWRGRSDAAGPSPARGC